MAEKEERIIIAVAEPSLLEGGAGKIYPCMTRQEAIERMEKAMKQYAKDEEIYTDKDLAIVALNSLLEGK